MPRNLRPLHAASRHPRRHIALLVLGVVLACGASGASAATSPLDAAACDCTSTAPRLGIDVLLSSRLDLLRGKRVGLVTNATGMDRALRSTVDRFASRTDFTLVALFGPEHGVRGDVQA
ncbi:MAG TPA: exo-beta-N-acetylmuramidase NamZ domain-containing protein, partial [Pseudoxanthomonas sp.]|nr:exo-beta-N-acetylmuramidase NamZ domain-containing protein [Pseudoxanthomonas sp.]